MSNSTVSMLTRELNSYRLAFFEQSRRALARDGIDFRLYVGGATSADRSKSDPAGLDWATTLPTRELRIRQREFWWQPAIRLARESDLIITEQASKQLTNVPLAILQRGGWTKHCLWGHGRNFQRSIEGSGGEALKQWFTRSAHWFFSYTELSTDALIELGFPEERITTFCNSTDVEEVRAVRETIGRDELERVRRELGLGQGSVVGYLGSLYAPKRIDFLLDSLDELHTALPDMDAIVIGSGTDASLVIDRARGRPWLHYVGAVYGTERVRLAATCDLLLMPGLVGLNIVDGFAMGLPTVTTAVDYHSPEIAYLEHDENGWVCPADVTPEEYAHEVADILTDSEHLRRLQTGAQKTGDELGTKQMVERFTSGIKQALRAPPRRRAFHRAPWRR